MIDNPRTRPTALHGFETGRVEVRIMHEVRYYV